jgi:hypothetical protein
VFPSGNESCKDFVCIFPSKPAGRTELFVLASLTLDFVVPLLQGAPEPPHRGIESLVVLDQFTRIAFGSFSKNSFEVISCKGPNPRYAPTKAVLMPYFTVLS